MKTKQDSYHIVAKDGTFRVFDKQGHYRRSFATQALAKYWIEQQEAASTHNKRLSRQETVTP